MVKASPIIKKSDKNVRFFNGQKSCFEPFENQTGNIIVTKLDHFILKSGIQMFTVYVHILKLRRRRKFDVT
jgi:hypothetical protein